MDRHEETVPGRSSIVHMKMVQSLVRWSSLGEATIPEAHGKNRPWLPVRFFVNQRVDHNS